MSERIKKLIALAKKRLAKKKTAPKPSTATLTEFIAASHVLLARL